MIADIESGKVTCVITKDLSRLGRNYIEAGSYMEVFFPRHNVRYIAITDGVDSLNRQEMEYALEQVYNVVDSRYLSRLPFIITTNLPLSELQTPQDLAHARIYDRVLERCTPVHFFGKNYRT